MNEDSPEYWMPLPEWAICRKCHHDVNVQPGCCECPIHESRGALLRAEAVDALRRKVEHEE